MWCASDVLCGCVAWGTPTPHDVEEMLAAFEGFRHPRFGTRFDVILDATRLVGVDARALDVLVTWLAENREELARRVRLQIGVIPAGIVGITMTGILPTLGSTHSFVIAHSPIDAFERLAGERGRALCVALERIVDDVSNTPSWLVDLRAALRATPTSARLETIAKRLAMAPRTLQRLLGERGTAFQEELARTRFELARDALVRSDEKIEAIAASIGVSSRSVGTLVQRFAGCSPSELRDTSRRNLRG